MDLSGLKWDAAALVTVIVQDRHTGELRMLAHASEQALRATVETGQAHFFSQSRGELWRKGETSGNQLLVSEVWVDCDADAAVYLVDPVGPSCHTGERSCFFRRIDGPQDAPAGGRAASSLVRLWDELERRRASSADDSYTRSLLDAGPEKIGDKVREEAAELAEALAGEGDDRLVSEAADVLYHLLVALLSRGLSLRHVQAELARRFGTSGHEEKASRST